MRIISIVLASTLAIVGCKKEEGGAASGSGSGSAAGSPAGSGSAMAGSGLAGSGSAMAGSGSAAAGSAMVGSGSGSAMEGSGAAAGSGSATAGSGSAAAMGSNGRPAAVTDEVVKIVEKAMVVVDKFATEVAAAGKDCKKATAAVKANLPAMIAVNTEMQKLQTKPDPAVEEWLRATHGDKLEASMKKALPTMEACKDDKDFVDAMKELPL